MSWERVLTCLIAAGALFVLYMACCLVRRERLTPLLIVLPLVLQTPWTKPFSAIPEAIVFFLTAVSLYLWLDAVRGGPRERKRAWIGALAIVAIRPDMVVFVLMAVLAEGLRQGKGIKALFKACCVIVCVAFARVLLFSVTIGWPLPPLQSLYTAVSRGLAWDSSRWLLGDKRSMDVANLAYIYGRYFYLILLPGAFFILWKCRRQWWFAPVAAWGLAISLLTLCFVRDSYVYTCMPMLTAMVITFGLGAVENIFGSSANMPSHGASAESASWKAFCVNSS